MNGDENARAASGAGSGRDDFLQPEPIEQDTNFLDGVFCGAANCRFPKHSPEIFGQKRTREGR
jgi:hypothetical protein